MKFKRTYLYCLILLVFGYGLYKGLASKGIKNKYSLKEQAKLNQELMDVLKKIPKRKLDENKIYAEDQNSDPVDIYRYPAQLKKPERVKEQPSLKK